MKLIMRRFLILFAASIVAIVSAAGIAAEPVQQSRFQQGVLWKVESADTLPSYVFGTVHVDDEKVLALPIPVGEAFNQAKIFAPEMINDNDSTRRFRAAMLSEEPTLPALMSESAYQRIDDLLGQHRVPAELRPRFKPWAAMLTLQQPRLRGTIVLDQLLLRNATQHKKTIVPLETIDEQIAAFNDMTQSSQLALLERATDQYQSMQEAIAPLIEAYLQRDLAALWRLTEKSLGENAAGKTYTEEFFSRVLYQRSQRMAERMLPHIRTGGLFAACGALHLYGERGVLKLLEQQGMKVTRVY
jgi:uncharacterized protein